MRSGGVIGAVLALIVLGVACTPRDVAQSDCLDSADVLTPPADTTGWPLPNGTWLADGATMDVRGALFDGSAPDAQGRRVALKVHYRSDSRADLCLLGGLLYSDLDPELTPWATWHVSRGVVVETPGFEVVGTRFINLGDLMVFSNEFATDWKVTGVRLDGMGTYPGGYAHDDCVENDWMHSGVISDSLFDGCQVFLSAQSGAGNPRDGTGNTVVVRDTLVRMRPFQESFKPEKYGYDQHGGFFKFSNDPLVSGIPPALVVQDSVFRADAVALYGGNANGFLALPPGTACDGVTLVGWEVWPADELASWTGQCTNITLGSAADWDAAVAAWDGDHPPL